MENCSKYDTALSMDSSNAQFPVSLDHFMKCTYYEELVDCLLETKSQGIEVLSINKKSDYSRKQILQKYYESFYLNPAIRHKFPIKFRPMPKNRRENISQVPTWVKTPMNTTAGKGDETNAIEYFKGTENSTEYHEGLVTPTSSKSIKRSAESVSQTPQASISVKRPKIGVPPDGIDKSTDECPYVRPAESAENSNNNVKLPKDSCPKSCSKELTLKDADALHNTGNSVNVDVLTTNTFEGTAQNVNALNSIETNRAINATRNSPEEENLLEVSSTSTPQQHNNTADKQQNVPEMVSPSTQNNKNSKKLVDFSAFNKLAHLCPVTLELFKKYTNITAMLGKGCELKYGDSQAHLKIITKRAYWLYYLDPINRYEYPLCHLQVNTNCPEILKMKILEIPKHHSTEMFNLMTQLKLPIWFRKYNFNYRK